jgi:hypothetical protein
VTQSETHKLLLIIFSGLEDDVPSDDFYPINEPQSQYYPATNTFAPPPTGTVGNPNYADPNYGMPRDHPVYNPAEYGPITGPTLPQQDPYPYNHTESYEPRYDDPNRRRDPENVSAPLQSEGHSEPGTSTRRSSANGDRQQG